MVDQVLKPPPDRYVREQLALLPAADLARPADELQAQVLLVMAPELGVAGTR